MKNEMLVSTVATFVSRWNAEPKFRNFWQKKGWDVCLGSAVYTDPQGRVYTYSR